MPQSTFEENVEKYIEMNVAHPFREVTAEAQEFGLTLSLKRN